MLLILDVICQTVVRPPQVASLKIYILLLVFQSFPNITRNSSVLFSCILLLPVSTMNNKVLIRKLNSPSELGKKAAEFNNTTALITVLRILQIELILKGFYINRFLFLSS